MLNYLVIGLLLLVALQVYFRLAVVYGIIDRPNERSSHHKPTIRGGGIVFPLALICWFLFFDFQFPLLLLGAILVAFTSFIDDMVSLNFRLRLLTQFLGVALMLYHLGPLQEMWWFYPLFFVLTAGWLNAFNFMDGINGITALYSLCTLLAFQWLNYQDPFLPSTFIWVLVLAVFIFGYFNVRKEARTFAGDIGSVTLAFALAFIMVRLLLHTREPYYLLLFLLYGLDSIVTILQRLKRGENIFEAHRSHLYQYLANEVGWSHITVSFLYFGLQSLFSAGLILVLSNPQWPKHIIIPSMVLLSALLYVYVKRRLQKKYIFS